MLIDLNADLGEGAGSDAALLKLITSANINCGFHAADPDAVRATLELAAAADVVVGAHPGYPDREHFGRREMTLTEKQVATLAFHQIGAIAALARLGTTEIRYLKPHGSLYHQACRDLDYARPLAAAAFDLGLALVGLPGSMLASAASQVKVPFVAEGFVDRKYRPDGTLVPRTEPEAMIGDPKDAASQAEWLVNEKNVRTLCIHGDSPGAVEFAAAVRQCLLDRGFTLKAFA
jgi:UPF0271 protein